MKKKPASKSAFFNQRVLIGFSFCLIGLVLALAAFNAYPGGNAFARQEIAAAPAVAQQNASEPASRLPATLAMVEDGPNLDGVAPVATGPAQPDVIGATFVVNTINDTADVAPGDGVCLDGAGACSLRAAISEANALAGADTITIGPVVYTTTLVAANEDLNAGGDYDIRSDITINGVSAATSILQANAAPNTATEKVLHITTGAGTVNINNVTIRNGNSTVNTLGGGVRIDNATNVVNITNSIISGNRVIIAGNAFAGGLGITAGSVTLTGCTISGNSAVASVTTGNGFAGGIYNQQATVNLVNSTLTGNFASSFHGGVRALASTTAAAITNITNSTISNNQAQGQNTTAGGGPGEGGGLVNIAGSTFASTMTVTGSTINGNAAQVLGVPGVGTAAGGIENFSVSTGPAVVNVTNSTISGNTAEIGGGGYSDGAVAAVTYKFSTIASNSATGSGGGIYQDVTAGGVTNLKDSIVADNTATTAGNDIFGTITSQNYNHLESTAGGTFAAMANDVVSGDPALGALANNGGPTFTHLPGGASVVLNTIPNGTNECGSIAVDQRALVRPSGAGCEKGSVEVQVAASPTPTVTPATPTPTVTPSATATPSPSASCAGSTVTFTNSAAITIPAGAPGVTQGAATPYPSNIIVAGSGVITKVTVVLNNITSTFPGDFDLLLVGPGGQSAVIMSDCGGGGDVTGITITLDDAAAAAMTGATLTTGTFRPTNLVGVAPEPDTWPAPAPAPPAGGTSALSVFNGTNANGTWNLYVFDDAAGDVSSFGGGWSLSITTGVGCPSPTPSATATPSASATPTASGTPTPPATPTPGACSSINGGLNPQPLTESGVAAPAGFFWSEVQHDVGNTTQANTNAGYADFQGTTRLADNFTLGGPCTINSVVFYGYLTGAPATPSPFTAYSLQIWNGRPGDVGAVVVFGDTTTNRLASSVDSTYFRIFNTAVPPPGTAQGTTRKIWRNTVTVGATLPAGTYWVDWASTVTGAVNHFAPAKTIQGARGAAGDNARQFTAGAWVDVVDAGVPAGGTPVPQDFPFEVNGTGGGTPPPSPSPGTPTPTPTPTATPSPCGVNTFTNSAAITIPDSGPGVPYPSNISVAGLTGTITKVTVRLNGLTHTFPSDIDLLLVSPGGQNAIIMSDVGGGNPGITGVTFTLDDAAVAPIPATNFVAGTYQPTNSGTGDTFPAPAPAPAGGSVLSVFNGGTPNGTWALYVVDDAALDLGSLSGGWTLNISTTTGTCATPTPGTPTPSPSCPPAANVIVDGTFEAGTPWTAWTVQTSTNFGTPMCDAGCGTGGGTAGGFGGSANWAWFGGTASAETATTGQSVVIASGGSASLTFQLWIGAVNTPFTDVLNVRVDGTIVATFTEPTVAEVGYTLRTVNLNAFANGASHAILFEYIGPGGAVSNFSVDNISLVSGGTCPTPTPSATPSIPPPTPTPSASPTATVPATPSPTATVPGTPSPTATVGVSPSPTPAVTSQAVNLSTRMRVQTGDKVGIGGFIVRGGPKTVLLRAIGPSLTRYKIEDVLADPVLELHGPTGFTTIVNDNWRVPNGPAIQATGIPPTNDLESAILATLNPGAYTGIVKGNGNTSGVALVEVYDLSPASGRLANISTRAFVSTGDNVVIAGFVLDDPTDGSGAPDSLILRGIGPSLTAAGVTSVLADPTLELRDSNGTLLISNNDWQDNPAQAALITAAGLAPSNNLEAAIAATLPPGLYTALLAGLNNTSGNGLVEVYDLGAQGGGPVPTPTPPGGTPTPSVAPSPGASPSPGVTPSPTPPGATPTPTPPASPTPSPATCTEAFDGLTAPALPTGWTASNEGSPPDNGVRWVTNTLTPDSAPNSAFVDDQNGVSDKYMITRNITINSGAPKITFRNFFSTEYDPPPTEEFWDGYVLEISRDGGATWADITDPAPNGGAGTFVTGGYTGEINGIASNPLAGRQAWSGENTGYISTEINLGSHLNGQTVKLRFRMGSDLFSPGDGVHVDSLVINGGACP